MEIRLYYSMDYEVYWTKNDDEREVLITPTNHLLTTLERLGASWTIFADVVGLMRYHELGLTEFAAAAESQLRDAVSRGHDVQTHIHPHWLRARRVENEWVSNPEEFVIGRLGRDEKEVAAIAHDLFTKSTAYLEDIIRPVNSGYRAIAFRAGGYGLQPHERAVIGAMQRCGYLIDSSVVPGMVMHTGRNAIDFRNVPKVPNWFISEHGGINLSADAGIYEVPIAAGTLGLTSFARVLTRYVRDRGGREVPMYGRGSSLDQVTGNAAVSGSPVASIVRKLRVMGNRWTSLSLPGDANALIDLLTRWVGGRHKAATVDVSLIIHPKTLTRRTLQDLETFHTLALRRFGDGISFGTFSNLGRILEAQC